MGTALKTIVARFSEVKELYSMDELTGTDSEGEAIEVNKIATALRTAGINLNEYFTGMKGLDDILLELASKWDTLSTVQQRYIATQAAGSRQQSRFIAMMSDYERTQELVTAANTAAGASNEQYAKTVDSLETKLNQLTNAWNTFTMGIANNSIIKAAVDALTALVTAINNITDIKGIGLLAKGGLFVGATTGLNNFTKIFQQQMGENAGLVTSVGKSLAGMFNFKKDNQNNDKTKNIFTTLVDSTRKYDQFEKDIAIADQDDSRFGEVIDLLFQENKALNENNLTIAQMNETESLYQQVLSGSISLKQKNTIEQLKNNQTLIQARAYTLAYDQAKKEGLSDDMADIVAKNAQFQATTKLSLATLKLTLQEKLNNVTSKLQIMWTKVKTAVQWENIKAVLTMAKSYALLAVEIAGIVIMIASLVAIFKQLISLTPANQLKAAQEATSQAAEAAQEATESYNELNDSLESLASKIDALDTLTKGTKEWNQAIQEINNSTIDLISKYPKLAELFETNKEGYITIDTSSARYAEIMREYQAGSIAASNMEYIRRLEENEKQQNVYARNFGNKNKQEIANVLAKAMDRTKIYEGTDEEKTRENIVNALTTARSNGELDISDWGITRAAKQFDSLSDEMQTYHNQLQELSNSTDAYTQAILDNIKKLYNDNDNYTDYQKDVANTVITDSLLSKYSSQYKYQNTNNLEASSDQWWKKILLFPSRSSQKAIDTNWRAWGLYDNAEFREATEDYLIKKGYSSVSFGDNLNPFNTYSFTVTGTNSSGTSETFSTDSELENLYDEVINYLGQEKLTENVDELLTKIDELISTGDDTGTAIQHMLTGAENLTSNDIELLMTKFTDKNGQEQYTYLQQLWTDNQELFGALYQDEYGNASYDVFLQDMLNILNSGKEMLDTYTTKFQAYGDNVVTPNFGTLNAESTNILSKGLYDILLTSGTESMNQIQTSMINLITGLTDEEKELFASAFASIDITDIDSIEKFSETLLELGLDLPEDEVEQFENDLISAGKAIHNIDLEELEEKLLNIDKVINDLKNGDQTRIFDDSTYQSIIEADGNLADSFVHNLDGTWSYVDDSIADLIAALNTNTSALLGESETQLTTKASIGKWANQQDNSEEWNNETDTSLALKNLQTWAKRQGFNLKDLGIDYFNNDVDIDKLDPDTRKQIRSQINNIIANQLDYEDTLMELTQSDKSIDYQKSTFSDNAFEVLSLRGQQNETDYEGRLGAMKTQALQAGISDTDFSNYVKALELYNNELEENGEVTEETEKQLQSYEDMLINRTTYKTAQTEVSELSEELQTLYESYDDATTEAAKIDSLNDAFTQFGITITEENYQTAGTLLQGLIQGDEAALEQLINDMLIANGLMKYDFEDLKGMSKETIEGMGGDLANFVETLERTGLAMFNAENGVLSLSFTNDIFKNIYDSENDEFEAWEYEYTWLDNMNEAINAKIRERERLERQYSRALEQNTLTSAAATENLQAQLAILQQQAEAESSKAASIQTELDSLMSYNGYGQFVGITNGQLVVDYNALNAQGWSDEQGQVFEDWLSRVEELRDAALDAEDNLNDIQDAVDEIAETGKEEYDDLLSRVRDALLARYQDEIDGLSDINSAIKEAADDITSGIQDQIDAERQARQNEETEQELADKQARLLYLKRDTSGRNATEIKALEKELSDATQSYEDSLVDQTLQKMQDAYARAEEQRQQQIDIQQSQLDFWEEYNSWPAAEAILESDLLGSADGEAFINSFTGQLLGEADNLQGMTDKQTEEWKKELSTDFSNAQVWATQALSEQVGEVNTAISTANAAVADSVDSVGTRFREWSQTTVTQEEIDREFSNFNTALATANANLAKIADPNTYASLKTNSTNTNLDLNKYNTSFASTTGLYQVGSLKTVTNSTLSANTQSITTVLNGQKVEAIPLGDGTYVLAKDATKDIFGNYVVKAGAQVYRKYATGGLADYTGPAWLDGTPSSPEMVLNPTDTKNFIQLRDILSEILRGNSNTTTTESTNGNNYFNIDINVDSIANDYDIDSVANRIKELITSDAMYRNVNAVSLIR